MVQDPDEDATPERRGPAARWAPRPPYWLTADFWRDLSWRDLAVWRRPGSRFEPGPLGLLGVMLSAMAVTLLLLQTGSGGLGGEQDAADDEPLPVPGPPDGELRIMMVGDSATQGSSGDHTWRYHLWSHLSGQGVEFDFVGPNDDMYSLDDEEPGDLSYAEPEFDTDHAARWGATAQELSTDIAQVAAEHDPQYLLLLAGTEDILAGGGADQALDGVAETVSTVRVVLDDARFVVGELPAVDGTSDDPGVNAEITRFNMGLVDLAQQLTSATSPVVVAQVAREYAPAFDNWDATHPNARGELKIAAAFADALAAPLGVGEEYARPLPELSVGPLTAPEPEYEQTDDGLLLSWKNVPGATDYRVVQRRVDPDPDAAGVIPADVESDEDDRSMLVGSLFSGARYEFVVHPFKGRDEGTESEPLQVLWDAEPPPAPSWIRVHDGGALVTWEDVAEAGHYEVWIRQLECGRDDLDVSRDRRVFTTPRELVGPRPGNPATDDQEVPDVTEPGVEEPGPTPTQRPEPSRPEPEPGPAPEPSVPAAPVPGVTCAPQDGQGPGNGDGWRSLGSVGERPRWVASVSGPYEIVVRTYRDYVEGGYSDSVVLSEG
ncbi:MULTISPECIES: SGNH/GDSL hydrolase family protein [unclassified Nocardiopsis]|uniref:SGNH/GDSL hydrolase family protein n=1 Tax=unclassified Nocardiopsis TaxID=2649073 RepID=UPI00066E3273|nr:MULTISPECIES: SGNH/GDSL hydrolase family protein [unclassified Nocardiopsis]MBQ1083922.1 GDSL family lipase [Nocardiopsis sp. B62]